MRIGCEGWRMRSWCQNFLIQISAMFWEMFLTVIFALRIDYKLMRFLRKIALSLESHLFILRNLDFIINDDWLQLFLNHKWMYCIWFWLKYNKKFKKWLFAGRVRISAFLFVSGCGAERVSIFWDFARSSSY
jgi:hypothetical protein